MRTWTTLACAIVLTAVGCGARDDGPATPEAVVATDAVTTTGESLNAASESGPGERDNLWIEDLEYLSTELTSRHVEPFHSTSRDEFEAEVAAVTAAVTDLSDIRIALEIQRIAALIGDAHTRTQSVLPPTVYPIGVELFDDGAVVAAASPEHGELLGASLVGVHGVPVADIMEAALPYVSGDTVAGKLPEALRLIASPEFVEVILDGTGPSPGVLTFNVEGCEEDVDLIAIPLDTWQTEVSPPEDRAVPLAGKRPHAYYWYEYLPEQDSLFVQYNVCADAPDLSFEDFTEDAFGVIGSERPDRLVIDLRLNTGGDSSVFQPFLDRLRDHPLAQEGNVAVLIGSRTFSSAIVNAIDLRTEANATLVGQRTLGSPNSYGEIGTFALPNSGILTSYSTRFFQLTEDGADALIPDILVERMSTDYFAGIDATFERALEATGSA